MSTERNANLHAASVDTPRQNGTLPANTQFQPVQSTLDGALWLSVAAQSGGPGGTSTPVTLDEYSTDAIPPSTLQSAGLTVSAGLRALNAAGNIDRLRTLASDADNQVAAQLGLLGAVARGQLFDGATWDRARSLASDTDAQAAAQAGLAGAVVRPQIYNGATFDRQRAPVSFAFVSATAAGLTALVAGVAGQQIRLLRYAIELTNESTSAVANIRARFADGAGLLNIGHLFATPAAAAAGAVGMTTTGWVDLGPIGFLGSVGAALNANLSSALTAGAFNFSIAYIQGVTT